MISTPIPGPVREAVFVSRPNRFITRCRIDGRVVRAHMADPGRLRELLIPGRRIWIRPATGKRKTRWSTALVQTPDNRGLISLDTTLPNRLVEVALRAKALPELAGWTFERREFPIEGGRLDFLLARGKKKLALEVKSVTLVEDRVALFPDAVTERGARHLRDLAGIARRKLWSAAVLFVVQRSDAREVHAAPHIDPAFAGALATARKAGVRILARRCRVSPTQVTLLDAIPVL